MFEQLSLIIILALITNCYTIPHKRQFIINQGASFQNTHYFQISGNSVNKVDKPIGPYANFYSTPKISANNINNDNYNNTNTGILKSQVKYYYNIIAN